MYVYIYIYIHIVFISDIGREQAAAGRRGGQARRQRPRDKAGGGRGGRSKSIMPTTQNQQNTKS